MRTRFLFSSLIVGLLAFGCISQADDSSRRKAAEELYELMGLKETNEQFASQMAAVGHKNWSAASLKEEFVSKYGAHFSEAELGELVAFYRTKTGQKFVQFSQEEVSRRRGVMEKAVQSINQASSKAKVDFEAIGKSIGQ